MSAAVFGSPVKSRLCFGAVAVVTGFAVGYSAAAVAAGVRATRRCTAPTRLPNRFPAAGVRSA